MTSLSLSTKPLAKAVTGLAFAAVLLLHQTAPATAGGEVNTGYFGDVAIQGYDTVAYFTENEAVKGSEQFKLKWLGAYWHFQSEEHRQLFADNPQKYAPQYGGHCATGMEVHGGLTRDVDPEAWAIVDDKLYLNYSKETNTRVLDGSVDLVKADANWHKYETAETQQ